LQLQLFPAGAEIITCSVFFPPFCAACVHNVASSSLFAAFVA